MEIKYTWEGVKQHPDEQTAGSPWFYVETYREFHKGLKIAIQELEKYSSLIQEIELESSPYEQEILRLKRMIEWGEELLKDTEKSKFDEITLSGVSWGSLRYLKAGILLKARQLILKRLSVLAGNRLIPRSVLKTFDERIEQLLNMAEQGMLNGLKPAGIFFEVVPEKQPEKNYKQPLLRNSTTGAKYSSDEVPIVDQALRKRCLSILNAIEDKGIDNQYDTIIREMSVILEDRVREISGYSGKASGAELFSAVVAKEPPLIKFSDKEDIQESAHLLFRGYSGFVRNEAMHKLVPSYTRERVLQLLGTVDYLLFLLSTAEVPFF